MTTPTFQELLTSQEARDRADIIYLRRGNGNFCMTQRGEIVLVETSITLNLPAVWQGYLQEAAPPPEPRVFSKALYFNVYDDDGIFEEGHLTRNSADEYQSEFRLACVRVEITATEGQFDD